MASVCNVLSWSRNQSKERLHSWEQARCRFCSYTLSQRSLSMRSNLTTPPSRRGSLPPRANSRGSSQRLSTLKKYNLQTSVELWILETFGTRFPAARETKLHHFPQRARNIALSRVPRINAPPPPPPKDHKLSHYKPGQQLPTSIQCAHGLYTRH